MRRIFHAYSKKMLLKCSSLKANRGNATQIVELLPSRVKTQDKMDAWAVENKRYMLKLVLFIIVHLLLKWWFPQSTSVPSEQN